MIFACCVYPCLRIVIAWRSRKACMSSWSLVEMWTLCGLPSHRNVCETRPCSVREWCSWVRTRDGFRAAHPQSLRQWRDGQRSRTHAEVIMEERTERKTREEVWGIDSLEWIVELSSRLYKYCYCLNYCEMIISLPMSMYSTLYIIRSSNAKYCLIKRIQYYTTLYSTF